MRSSPSKAGPVSLLVLVLVLSMFPGGSTNNVPVGEFDADTVEVPILANETIGLDDPASVHWKTPIGWSGNERLEEIFVYSGEGHAIRYGVDDTALPGGRGIVIVSSSNHTIPEGIDRMQPFQFMGPMFIAFAGETLYELDHADMVTKAEVSLDFEPLWHGNPWNRWSVMNNLGELLYVMANETTVGMYAKIPPNPAYGEFRERRFYQTVTLDDYFETTGSRVVGGPIVLNVPLVENGSLIVVPTDHGIAALFLDYRVSGNRVVDVGIGEMAWYNSYDDIGQEVEPVDDRPISIALENPSEQRGKDRIFLMTKNGLIHSMFRENGTLDWSLDLMGDIDLTFAMNGIWPDSRGNLIVTATVDIDGFVVAVDPDHGNIMGNGSYYHFTPDPVLMRPEYVQSARSYIFNNQNGTVYILNDRMDLIAQFEVPGGLATDVSYLGNIVNNIGSSQGNYYAAITKNTTLWIQGTTGFYTPPPLPDVDPDGQRVVIVTEMGNITLGLFTNETPRTSSFFMELVESGTYTNTPIAFVEQWTSIRTGDPGNPGSDIPNEGSALALGNHYGAVSMVPHGPGRTGPELMIVAAEWGDHQRDGESAVFGVVLEGMDVVKAINEVPVDGDNRPIDEVLIQEVVISKTPGQNGGDDRQDDDWPLSVGMMASIIGIIVVIIGVVAMVYVRTNRSEEH